MLTLASDWLTIVKKRGVSNVWRRKTSVRYIQRKERRWWHHNSELDRDTVEHRYVLSTLCHDDVIKSKSIFRVPGSQMPVTRSLDVFFDLHLNKRLSKQSWGWWFETPSCSWWRHCNDRNITPGFRPRVVLRCYVWINPRKRFSKQGVTNITRKGNRHLGLERHAPIESLPCSVFSSLQKEKQRASIDVQENQNRRIFPRTKYFQSLVSNVPDDGALRTKYRNWNGIWITR